jgi:hypothetical protein
VEEAAAGGSCAAGLNLGGNVALTVTPVETAKWRVREYRDGDWPGLIQLGKLHHGQRDLADPRYAEWLARCDFAAKPILIVGESVQTGDLIAAVWVIPFRAKCNGAPGLSYVGCNGIVHPDFRRTVIYMPLLKKAAWAASDGFCIYGFPKPNALAHYRRIEMNYVSRMPLLVRPLDTVSLTRNRIGNWALRLATTLGWFVASNTVFRPRGVNAKKWGLRLREESEFDESFDRFWDKVADKYDTVAVRDRAFLTWRFTGLGFRTYRILTARAGDDLSGYLIFRYAEFAGVRSGLICDLLVEPGARGQAAGLLLVREATRQFANARIVLGGSLMLEHTEEYRILRRAGYVDCPPRLAPQRFQLIAKPTGPGITHEYLSDPTHWFLTMADHDAV